MKLKYIHIFTILVAMIGFFVTKTNAQDFNFEVTNFSANSVGNFSYSSSNNNVTGILREGNMGIQARPLIGGSEINLNATFVGNSIAGGNPGIINGVSYSRVYFSGQVEISSQTYRIPKRFSRQRTFVTLPVTLTATVNYHEQNPFVSSAPMISTEQLSLQGTVKFSVKVIGITNGKPEYAVKSCRYSFGN